MTSTDITIYVFLALAFIAALKFIFSGDADARNLQKVLGSLLILTAALISESPTTIGVAVFVSGLVVATEDFMKFVAAIWKTRSDKVPETVAALLAPAPDEEFENSIEEEVKEEMDEPDDSELRPTPEIIEAEPEEKRPVTSEKIRDRIEKTKDVVSMLQPFILDKHGDSFQSQIKITLDNEKPLYLDGVVTRKNGKICYFVEIKLITSKSFPNFKYQIRSIQNKLKRRGLPSRVMVYIVSEDLTEESAEWLYTENKKFASGIRFFRLENEKITEIEIDKQK